MSRIFRWKWPISQALAWSPWITSRTATWPPRITMSSLWLWPIKQSPKRFWQKWLSRSKTEFSSGDGLYRWLEPLKLSSNVQPTSRTGHLFQEPASLEAYRKALEIAFQRTLLSWNGRNSSSWNGVPLFVLNGQCEAVLLRVAANVVGDGQHTVRELVAIKNDNPMRRLRPSFTTRNHWTGGHWTAHGPARLWTRRYPAGVKVYLPQFNISIGGDSIDVTNSMHHLIRTRCPDMARL